MPGAQVRSASYNAYTALAAGLLAWGAQAIWVIDPANGNDAGDGSAVSPLRTMAELSSRLSGNFIQQPVVLQLVGDVLDSPLMLSGIRFGTGASIAVQGTRTQVVAGGSISAVTALGAAGTAYPWQITTAGVNWTTQAAGSQIRFSNSTVAFIVQVIDANNVIVEPTSSAGLATIPTTSLSFSVETLSKALPPYLVGVAAGPGSIVAAPVTYTDLSLNAGGCTLAGIGLQLLWCEVQVTGTQEWDLGAFARWLGCRASLATGSQWRLRSSPTQMIMQACSLVGAAGASALVLQAGGGASWNTCSFQNCRLQVDSGAFVLVSNGMYFRNCSTNPLTIDGGSTYYIQNNGNGSLNGSSGNVGTAVSVPFGRLIYTPSTAKPTMTATAASDIRLGTGTGPVFTYAAVGTGKITATLDAIPPTSVNLLLSGGSSFGQLA